MSDKVRPDLYIDNFFAESSLSFTSFQFRDEFWNTVINATLVTLIVVNFGSIAYKLMNRTEKNCFEYNHWIRALVYSNSDDPLRLLSWVLGKYGFRKPEWSRNTRVTCRRHLAAPLCTRTLLLLLTVVSIVISAPSEKILQGCAKGDHKLVIDVERARKWAESREGAGMPSLCVPVNIDFNIGKSRSTVEYCAEFGRFDNKSLPNEFSTDNIPRLLLESASSSMQKPVSRQAQEPDMVVVVERSNRGVISTYAQNNRSSTFCWGFKSSVDWYGGEKPAKRLASYLPGNWDLEDFGKLVELAVSKAGQKNCEFIRRIDSKEKLEDEKVPEKSYYALQCGIDLNEVGLPFLEQLEKYFRGGLRWEKTRDIQRRVLINQDGQSSGSGYRVVQTCPVSAGLQTPWLNILPLTTILIMSMMANILVSIYIDRVHGNILDANFHIINEVLERDTTCNPLERSKSGGEVEHLKLKLWQCITGAMHVGFLRRDGDIEAGCLLGKNSDDESENNDRFVDLLVTKCQGDGKYIFGEKNMCR